MQPCIVLNSPLGQMAQILMDRHSVNRTNNIRAQQCQHFGGYRFCNRLNRFWCRVGVAKVPSVPVSSHFFLAQTLEFIQRQHDIAERIVINYFPRLCGSSCPVLVTAASFTLDFTCVLEFHFFCFCDPSLSRQQFATCPHFSSALNYFRAYQGLFNLLLGRCCNKCR